MFIGKVDELPKVASEGDCVLYNGKVWIYQDNSYIDLQEEMTFKESLKVLVNSESYISRTEEELFDAIKHLEEKYLKNKEGENK